MRLTCEYCGREGSYPDEIEYRPLPSGVNARVVACRDTKACDAREEAGYRAHLTELRRRQREGDELTEAERQELAE